MRPFLQILFVPRFRPFLWSKDLSKQNILSKLRGPTCFFAFSGERRLFICTFSETRNGGMQLVEWWKMMTTDPWSRNTSHLTAKGSQTCFNNYLHQFIRKWSRSLRLHKMFLSLALYLSYVFCSTSLPLTNTRWVRSTIKLLHCPISKQCAVDKSQQHQVILNSEKNWEHWKSKPGAAGREARMQFGPPYLCHYVQPLMAWRGIFLPHFKIIQEENMWKNVATSALDGFTDPRW